jgi:hypothetical protein
MKDALEFLHAAQNPDGGWGYKLGGMSYVEPTSGAILALTRARDNSSIISPARGFLSSTQNADGGWGIGTLDEESGWMTAWGALALAQFAETRTSAIRGAQWLLRVEGLHTADENARALVRRVFQMDASLRGWPWQVGDAAWVYPTALAILALRATDQDDAGRVAEGVRYLYDRACPDGGWNVGNPVMFGQHLPATIENTALALIALAAVQASASDAPIANALAYLQDAVTRAEFPADLAWGLWGLKHWQIQSPAAQTKLRALQKSDGSWEQNPLITSIALLAE